MIKPEQIPPAALEAAERTYRTVPLWTSHADSIRAAIVATLNAWPGMLDMTEGEPGRETREIILPLPPPAAGGA